MSSCNKVITEKTWMGRWERICGKPIYRSGLCKHHHTRAIEKMKHWIDRDNYRAATENDLINGRSLKLKNTHLHELYKYKNGKMTKYSYKFNRYLLCEVLADFNLFCVKIY